MCAKWLSISIYVTCLENNALFALINNIHSFCNRSFFNKIYYVHALWLCYARVYCQFVESMITIENWFLFCKVWLVFLAINAIQTTYTYNSFSFINILITAMSLCLISLFHFPFVSSNPYSISSSLFIVVFFTFEW